MEETVGVKLVAQDLASGPLARVQTELRGLGGAAGGIASKGLSLAERAVGSVGGAINHLKGTIGGLVTGPLGFLGLTAGVLGLGGALKTGIDTLNATALAIEKLTGLTGEDAAAMSGLLAVTGKFNISSDQLGTIVGFETKTLGKLAETYVKTGAAGKSAALVRLETQRNTLLETNASTKHIDVLIKEQKARDALTAANTKALPPVSKLQALQKLYGVALTDSKGRALDFSQVLNNVSDYYQTNASAGQKAALASTVFGRGYSVLIPVLKLGSKGFAEAKAAAASLGLTLDNSNETQLMKYQETMRTLGDAVSGLELQLSLKLIPALTGVANTAIGFIRGHSDDILGFFSQLITNAQTAAAFLTGTVIPDIKAIGGAAKSAWDQIPEPIKNLLIGAAVTQKTVKFLFGIDVAADAGKALEALFGGLASKALGTAASATGSSVLGSFAGRGQTALAPLYVSVVNGVPGGGGTNVVPNPEEDTGIIGVLKRIAGPLLAASIFLPVAKDVLDTAAANNAGTQTVAGVQGTWQLKGKNLVFIPNEPGATGAPGSGTGSTAGDGPAFINQSSAATARGPIAGSQMFALIMSINKLAFIEQHRLEAHAAAKKAVGGSGDPFHAFLLELRGGKIATAIKDFPKEISYLASASDSTKASAVFLSGVQQDIKALNHDMVGATDSQKRVLSADISKLKLQVSIHNSFKISAASIDSTRYTVKAYGPQNREF